MTLGKVAQNSTFDGNTYISWEREKKVTKQRESVQCLAGTNKMREKERDGDSVSYVSVGTASNDMVIA